MWSEKIDTCIIYEDTQILVCHKPAGLAVQNARIGTMDMESALKNYLTMKNLTMKKNMGKNIEKSIEKNTKNQKQQKDTREQEVYLGVIHRLDQPVEGILVFAKTAGAAKELNRQMTAGQMKKTYLAVTEYRPSKTKAKLEDYLKKDGRTNTSSVVKAGTPGAKKAILTYEVEQEKEGKYLIRIQLETGRHHQIRVQMAHEGMPLAGDQKYAPVSGNTPLGHVEPSKAAQKKMQLGLCAVCLSFRHPGTRKEMKFEVTPKGETFCDFFTK